MSAERADATGYRRRPIRVADRAAAQDGQVLRYVARVEAEGLGPVRTTQGGTCMEYWKVTPSGSNIVITCRGHDREGTARAAVAEFQVLAEARASFCVIADLREMTGYESESRKHWQVVFRAYQERITKLVVIGAQGPLIKMGAAAAAAYAGIPASFIEAWEGRPDDEG